LGTARVNRQVHFRTKIAALGESNTDWSKTARLISTRRNGAVIAQQSSSLMVLVSIQGLAKKSKCNGVRWPWRWRLGRNSNPRTPRQSANAVCRCPSRRLFAWSRSLLTRAVVRVGGLEPPTYLSPRAAQVGLDIRFWSSDSEYGVDRNA